MIIEFCKILVLNPEDVLGESRRQEHTLPRMLYWKLLMREGYKLSEIARLNGRTHSTVIYALRRADELIEVDREVRKMWEQVEGIKRQAPIPCLSLPNQVRDRHGKGDTAVGIGAQQ